MSLAERRYHFLLMAEYAAQNRNRLCPTCRRGVCRIGNREALHVEALALALDHAAAAEAAIGAVAWA